MKVPLIEATKANDIKTIKQLLEKEPTSIDTKDMYRQTALHWACKRGSEEVVNVLLEHSANINVQNDEGDTPLFYACLRGNKTIFDELMKRNADIKIKNETGELCLSYAFIGADSSCPIVSDLFRHDEEPIMDKGHVDIAKDLLKHFDMTEINSYGETLLFPAVIGGNVQLVNILIKKNADVNFKNDAGESPLYVSCISGQTEIFKLLMDNVNIHQLTDSKESIFFAACAGGSLEIVKMLMDRKVDIFREPIYGQSPFHVACLCGQEKVVKHLANFVEVDSLDREKNSPLFAAISNKHASIVQFLLTLQVDVKRTNIEGKTPLFLACEVEDLSIVNMLLTLSDINHKNQYTGLTALHVACKLGNLKLSSLLVDHGADGLIQNFQKESPLDLACKHGHLEIAKFLMNSFSYNLNRTAPWIQDTPLSISIRFNQPALCQYFIQQPSLHINTWLNRKTYLHYVILNIN